MGMSRKATLRWTGEWDDIEEGSYVGQDVASFLKSSMGRNLSHLLEYGF
jgi:hypothetical protein